MLNDLEFDCRQRQGVLLFSKTPRPTLKPTTYSSIGTSGSFPKDKGAEAWRWLLISIFCLGKERIELYFTPTYAFIACTGITLPFLLMSNILFNLPCFLACLNAVTFCRVNFSCCPSYTPNACDETNSCSWTYVVVNYYQHIKQRKSRFKTCLNADWAVWAVIVISS